MKIEKQQLANSFRNGKKLLNCLKITTDPSIYSNNYTTENVITLIRLHCPKSFHWNQLFYLFQSPISYFFTIVFLRIKKIAFKKESFKTTVKNVGEENVTIHMLD